MKKILVLLFCLIALLSTLFIVSCKSSDSNTKSQTNSGVSAPKDESDMSSSENIADADDKNSSTNSVFEFNSSVETGKDVIIDMDDLDDEDAVSSKVSSVKSTSTSSKSTSSTSSENSSITSSKNTSVTSSKTTSVKSEDDGWTQDYIIP